MDIISYYTLDNILIFSTKTNIYVYDLDNKQSPKYTFNIDEKYSKFNIHSSCDYTIFIQLSHEKYICGNILSENTYKPKNFNKLDNVFGDHVVTSMVKVKNTYYIAVDKKIIIFKNCNNKLKEINHTTVIKSLIIIDEKLIIIDSSYSILQLQKYKLKEYNFRYNLNENIKEDNSILVSNKDKIFTITKVTDNYIEKYLNPKDEKLIGEIKDKHIIETYNTDGSKIQLMGYFYFIYTSSDITIDIKNEWIVISCIEQNIHGLNIKKNNILRISSINKNNYIQGCNPKNGRIILVNYKNGNEKFFNGPYYLEVLNDLSLKLEFITC